MKFCTNCGAQVPDGSKFCTECGQKMEPAVVATPIAPAAPQQPVYAAPQEPVYEAPQQPAYVAPQQPAYEAPQQPAYEAPQQPAYEAPQQPAYEAPQQPAYEAPQQPAYEAPRQPAYEAPQQPAYEAPQPKYYGNANQSAPNASAGKEKKPLNKKLLVFGGIGVLLILVIILLVSCIGGGNADDPNLGVYNATSCVAVGMELGADGEWIELKAKGKVDMLLLGSEYSGKWKLDGENFVLTQAGTDYSGTLKNGVLTLDFAGMVYTFVKEGVTPPPAETTAPTVAANVGYWTLLRMDSEDPSQAASEEDVAMLKSLGLEMYVDMKEDGTGTIMLDDLVAFTWADGKLTANGESLDYTIENDHLLIAQDGITMVFARGEAPNPGATVTEPVTVTDPASTSPYSWWDGEWYGWWVVYSAHGEFEELEDSYWDAYANIQVNDDDTGYLELWDSDCEAGEIIAWADVSFGSGLSEIGCMISENGYFYDNALGHADWIADPPASEARFFEDMICIDGTYEDPSNEDNYYDYYVFLRPWGMYWEDVRNADTSECLYDEMMPAYYDDWYLPLINRGVTAMPDSYADGLAMAAGASSAGSAVDADASGVIGDYTVSFVGAEQITDYEGNPALRVYYDFTNNSSETTTALGDLGIEFRQDGYELISTFANDSFEIPEYGNEYRYIRPGVTIRCAAEYIIKEDGGDVEIRMYDYWNESTSVTVSYDLQNLPGRPAKDLQIVPVSDPQWIAEWPSEGTYSDDYYVSIASTELTSDDSGNDLLRVYFNFTNNSSEAISPWYALYIQLYQDGIALDTGFAEVSVEEDDNYYADVEPGASILASVCYELSSSSPVEVEISELWTNSGIGAVIELH